MKKFLSMLFTLCLIGGACAYVYFNQDFSMRQLNKIKGMYYVYKGDRAYHKAELQEAILYYNKGLKLFPGHYGAWYNLGNIYVSYEDYYSSIYAYSQAFKHNPKMMIARMNYGIISSERLGDFDSAITQYDKIIETKRHLVSIPYIYNNKLSSKQNRAIAYYNKGVSYRLKSLYANDNWELQRKYLSKAIESYEKSIEINPDSYDTQYNLGLAYHISGNTDAAGLAYCKAINLAPLNYEAHYNLAILLRKLGHYDDALDEINKASTIITAMDENSAVQQYAAIMMNDITRSVYKQNPHKKVLETLLDDEKSKTQRLVSQKNKETKVNNKQSKKDTENDSLMEDFGKCPAEKYFNSEQKFVF